MDYGQFSVSLPVADIEASRSFYEKLGFYVVAGNQEENWLILRRGDTVIGLFQGMFERTLLTFNPQDVRSIQKQLRANGVTLIEEAEESGEGAAHITMEDPDGNPILFDQIGPEFTHAGRPKGSPVWIDLTVDNASEIRDFYQAVVGFGSEPLSMGAYDDYVMTDGDGTVRSGICHRRGSNASLPPQWLVYFAVADVDSATAECERRGGSVLERQNQGGQNFAVIRDPAGAVCALFQV